MNRLPYFATRYFWDVDTKKLDTDKHATYVIERLLELGNPQAVRWLLRWYSKRKIVGVLKKTRALSRMSASFWAVYFGVPRKEIACLSKLSPKRPSGVWPN
jgi:diketogulonate reductase-like aldo/keto reductase